MWARRAAVFFGSLCAALVVAELVLFFRIRRPDVPTQEALNDPRVRQEVVAQLLSSNPGVFDSHPDPEVARVMAPNLRDVPMLGALISTNAWGMRERPYELPKPPGVTRVVLLGDSYVFGNGIAADERFGVFLEQALRERAGASFTGQLEVLHVGIGSWNVIAECTFVRRQLSDLDPDLVVQVIVPNDLDDNAGVRGFGVRSDFDPLYPERADARVHYRYPVDRLGAKDSNYLFFGLDHESRERYATASAHVLRLAHALDRRGARYLLVLCVGSPILDLFLSQLDGELPDEELAFVDMRFMTDLRFLLSDADRHWNRAGHERMARYLYGMIETRALLPELGLAPWPEAERELAELHEPARAGLAGERLPRPRIPAKLVLPTQIYGGIDAAGFVAPYASLLLSPHGGTSLVLAGRCLDRPELDGATVEVRVEESSVGSFTLSAGEPIDLAWPLPDDVAARDYVNVRLVSGDWVYLGDDRRDCRSFHLDRLEFK